MSYFTDTQNDFAIYDSQKTGGTTLRLWIAMQELATNETDRAGRTIV